MVQNKLKLGVIGYGNMASAILSAAVESGSFTSEHITVIDKSEERVNLAKTAGFCVATSCVQLVEQSDIILLSVKPQQFEEVLDDIKLSTAGKCVVSIAAGISAGFIRDRLAAGTYIIRVMPNTPIMLGFGATVVADCPDVPETLKAAAISLFDRAGVTVFLPEDKIDEATGLNGSSPAYFFLMAEAMLAAGAMQGIEADDALKLAANTMRGAAEMLLQSGKTPGELREMVCSPNGTTLAALNEMEHLGFSNAIVSGMLACTRRARELGR